MPSVAPGNQTVAFIRQKVRRLTASSGQSTLRDADLDQYIQNAYFSDFPYAIKIDQMRSVHTFYTEPYKDRYPLDVNYNQGVRAPLYVDGILGSLFKDRGQFFNLWPKFPTKFSPIAGDGEEVEFTFTIPGPILAGTVTLGGIGEDGFPITVADDGEGNLNLYVPNPIVTIPPYTDVYTAVTDPTPDNPQVGKPIPGMHNSNTLNPGLYRLNTETAPFTLAIGAVNYVTGEFDIEFPVPPAEGTQMTLRVTQYQPGRPYNLLFWNNEFTVRPIPREIHKIEIETYLTPIQFLESTDQPILAQWAQYLAYIAAMEIMRDRNDFEGVEGLREGFMRQEGLVLERQGVEEIGTPNYQLFNTTSTFINGGWGNYWYY